MKKGIIIIASLMLITFYACNENTQAVEFTGREYTYSLFKASDYDVSGTITLKEKTNGSTLVSIKLEGTEGNAQYPVHLHMGSISEPDVEVAALLSPVLASKGKSESILTRLADESPVTYEELLKLDACIRIHLAEFGPERDIILAAGNIGLAYEKELRNGFRESVAICKSE